jgi:hypothetical protein
MLPPMAARCFLGFLILLGESPCRLLFASRPALAGWPWRFVQSLRNLCHPPGSHVNALPGLGRVAPSRTRVHDPSRWILLVSTRFLWFLLISPFHTEGALVSGQACLFSEKSPSPRSGSAAPGGSSPCGGVPPAGTPDASWRRSEHDPPQTMSEPGVRTLRSLTSDRSRRCRAAGIGGSLPPRPPGTGRSALP